MDDKEFFEMAERADAALSDGNTEAALADAEVLIAFCRAQSGDEDAETLIWRAFRAKALTEARRYSEAESELAELLVIRERLEGVDSPATMRVRGNLARAMALNGRTDEALLIANRLLADRQRLLGDDHPETLDTEGHIAHFTYLSGDSETSAQLYSQLLEKRREVLGWDHPVTLQTEQNLTAVSARRSDPASLERLRESARELEETEGPDHVSTLNAYGMLAERLVSAGEFDEGLALASHVRTSRERMLGSSHPNVVIARHTAARALAGLERVREAWTELFALLDTLDRVDLGSDETAMRVMCDIIEFSAVLARKNEVDELDSDRIWDVWERLNEAATALPPDHLAHEVIEDYRPMFDDDGGDESDKADELRGALSFLSADDPRHRLHWTFAFQVIPAVVLSKFCDELLRELNDGNCTMLRSQWLRMGGAPHDASSFSSMSMPIPHGTLTVITMPESRTVHEAIFVAIAKADSPTSWGGTNARRILYLESTLLGTALGESTGPNSHKSLGFGCEPVVESFAQLVRDLLING